MRLKGNQVDPDGTLPLAALEGHGFALGNPWFGLKNPYYVDSNNTRAKDKPRHGTKFRPWATVAYAVSQAVADSVIIVNAAHTETVSGANAWPFANAGVKVLGLGRGSRRPTITFATSTAAQIILAKEAGVLCNLRFKNSIDDLVKAIKVATTASYSGLFQLDYQDDANDETAVVIDVASGAAYVEIRGLHVVGNVGGNSGDICVAVGNCPGCLISDFDLYGDYPTGVIVNYLAAASPPGLIIEGGHGSSIWTAAPEDLAIKVLDDTVGRLAGPLRIRLADNAANIDEAISDTSGAGCGKMQAYNTGANIISIVNADGESGLQWPGTPSTDDA